MLGADNKADIVVDVLKKLKLKGDPNENVYSEPNINGIEGMVVDNIDDDDKK